MSSNRKLPDKKENLKDTCPLCDEPIHVGVKKAEGYPDKLQWWGENNKAHYTWDGHKNTCNILNPKQGSKDPEPPAEQKQPSTEQIKEEVKTVNGPMMVDCDWWERRWPQALRIASHTCKCAQDTQDARICACGIMHDFASLEVARAFKKLLEAEKK